MAAYIKIKKKRAHVRVYTYLYATIQKVGFRSDLDDFAIIYNGI